MDYAPRKKALVLHVVGEINAPMLRYELENYDPLVNRHTIHTYDLETFDKNVLKHDEEWIHRLAFGIIGRDQPAA